MLLTALLSVGLADRALAAPPSVGNPTPVTQKMVAPGQKVAFDGTNDLVVWSDFGNRVFAARVSGDGATVTQLGPIATTTAPHSSVDVAFNGTTFLTVWESSTGGGDIRLGASAPPAA